MKFIWATRGRTWGFRFLEDGGYVDPLSMYEDTFSEIGNQPQDWGRVAGRVALRFPDPEGRQDAAGRVIPHEFVIFRPEADQIDSLDEGFQLIWPKVEARFEDVWDRTEPSSALS